MSIELMFVRVPEDELQDAYETLERLNSLNEDFEPLAVQMLKDIFFGLTEVLLEKHCPPYRGGEQFDRRKANA